MSVKSFAAQLRQTIATAKAQGTAAIYCDNLIAYLSEVVNSPEPEPSPAGLEEFKAHLQARIEAQKQQHEAKLEMFKSVITAGQSAIKSAFLLNGGAAVSLLAFIGHLAQVKPTLVPTFTECLVPFGIGVFAIALTSGLTYLSQWMYASTKEPVVKAGFVLNIVCIVAGLSSYACFLWGLSVAHGALTAYA